VLRGTLDDATARYLEEVAIDIHGLLGPGMKLADLAIEEAGSCITLRARYGMADESVESVGHGQSAIEAHAELRRAIVGDRIGLGLRLLT
jgi:NDP-sugar pyrophosphorylase family protein